MPQADYTQIPTYEEKTASWQDNPELYTQQQGQNNSQNDSGLLPFVMWTFIFFCPGIITILFKRFLEEIEIFCTYTTSIGVILLLLLVTICLFQGTKQKIRE